MKPILLSILTLCAMVILDGYALVTRHVCQASTTSLLTVHRTPTSRLPQKKSEGTALMILSEDTASSLNRTLHEADFYCRKRSYAKALSRATDALRLDAENTQAISISIQAKNGLQAQRSEDRLLEDANEYFASSQFDGAVLIYNRYLDHHPEDKASIQPMILKCYYNLGVIALRRRDCVTASQYFHQNLLLEAGEPRSEQALSIAETCQDTESLELIR